MALPYSSLAKKSMLHNAVGSMPAQPEKDPNTEEIITPVEEETISEEEVVEEEEIGLNEPSDDVPTEEDEEVAIETPLEAPELAPEGSEVDSDPIAPEEEETISEEEAVEEEPII